MANTHKGSEKKPSIYSLKCIQFLSFSLSTSVILFNRCANNCTTLMNDFLFLLSSNFFFHFAFCVIYIGFAFCEKNRAHSSLFFVPIDIAVVIILFALVVCNFNSHLAFWIISYFFAGIQQSSCHRLNEIMLIIVIDKSWYAILFRCSWNETLPEQCNTQTLLTPFNIARSSVNIIPSGKWKYSYSTVFFRFYRDEKGKQNTIFFKYMKSDLGRSFEQSLVDDELESLSSDWNTTVLSNIGNTY